MDYKKTYPSLKNQIPENLINLSNNSHNQLIKLFNRLISTGQLPENPLTSFQINYLLTQFSIMDSNNMPNKVGIGEREGRVKSEIIKNRYFSMFHGIGRSGDVLAIQPKAAGSTLLQQLTHRILIHVFKILGLGVFKCIILPVATGMAMTLSLLYLRSLRKDCKYVVFLRIDQKSCLKSVFTAGLEPVVVENRIMSLDDFYNKDVQDDEIYGLECDLSNLEAVLQRYKEGEILTILSTTSCFAPREPDDIIEIGKLARKYKTFHLVNNAYGLQCQKTIDMINKASKENLIDLVVQSTDKNFLVPVGGSIIFSKNKKYIKGISQNYPGRASANAIIDLFLSFTNLGQIGIKKLIKQRKENFIYVKTQLKKFAENKGEKIIINKRNKISMAFTLKNFRNKNPEEFGAWLFNRGIMGARICTKKLELKEIGSLKFENYGGHVNGDYLGFPYVTVAVAIGSERDELEYFLKSFCATYEKYFNKVNK